MRPFDHPTNQPTTERELRWSTFSNQFTRTPQSHRGTWSDFLNYLESRRYETSSKEGWAFSPGFYPPDLTRHNDNVEGADLIAIDIDDGKPLAEIVNTAQRLGWSALLYTSSSHQLPSKGGGDKCRLVWPLNRTATPAELVHVNRTLTEQFGGDKKATDAARIFFGPRARHPELEGQPEHVGQPEFIRIEGEPLDLDAWLCQNPLPTRTERKAVDPSTIKVTKKTRRRARQVANDALQRITAAEGGSTNDTLLKVGMCIGSLKHYLTPTDLDELRKEALDLYKAAGADREREAGGDTFDRGVGYGEKRPARLGEAPTNGAGANAPFPPERLEFQRDEWLPRVLRGAFDSGLRRPNRQTLIRAIPGSGKSHVAADVIRDLIMAPLAKVEIDMRSLSADVEIAKTPNFEEEVELNPKTKRFSGSLRFRVLGEIKNEDTLVLRLSYSPSGTHLPYEVITTADDGSMKSEDEVTSGILEWLGPKGLDEARKKATGRRPILCVTPTHALADAWADKLVQLGVRAERKLRRTEGNCPQLKRYTKLLAVGVDVAGHFCQRACSESRTCETRKEIRRQTRRWETQPPEVEIDTHAGALRSGVRVTAEKGAGSWVKAERNGRVVTLRPANEGSDGATQRQPYEDDESLAQRILEDRFFPYSVVFIDEDPTKTLIESETIKLKELSSFGEVVDGDAAEALKGLIDRVRDSAELAGVGEVTFSAAFERWALDKHALQEAARGGRAPPLTVLRLIQKASKRDWVGCYAQDGKLHLNVVRGLPKLSERVLLLDATAHPMTLVSCGFDQLWHSNLNAGNVLRYIDKHGQLRTRPPSTGVFSVQPGTSLEFVSWTAGSRTDFFERENERERLRELVDELDGPKTVFLVHKKWVSKPEVKRILEKPLAEERVTYHGAADSVGSNRFEDFDTMVVVDFRLPRKAIEARHELIAYHIREKGWREELIPPREEIARVLECGRLEQAIHRTRMFRNPGRRIVVCTSDPARLPIPPLGGGVWKELELESTMTAEERLCTELVSAHKSEGPLAWSVWRDRVRSAAGRIGRRNRASHKAARAWAEELTGITDLFRPVKTGRPCKGT